MQELPEAARGVSVFEARRWWSLVAALIAALIAFAASPAAFAQLNTPPLFTSIPPTSATEDAPYSYSITTADLNIGDTRTLTAPTKPAWLNFTPGANGSGTLTGTPAQAQVGNHPVVLSVSDGTISVTQSFTIVVANVDDQPVFTSTPATAATEDVPYSYAITATDADGNTLTITSQGTPGWLTFAAGANGNATLSGTPAQAQVGNHNVSLRVSDGSGPQVQQNFTIVVTGVNDPPVFTSAPVTSATQGAAYSYSITTSDPENNARTVTAPTKPAWLTFTPGANGSATLSGTPTQAQVGSHSVVLSVSDGSLSATQSFTIVVANLDDQPVFTSTPVTTAVTGALYTYSIVTTDADGDALTVTAPTKPAWLTFAAGPNGTATLSGTPTQANVGANSVQLRVSDGTGALVQQNFSIVVTHTNNPPAFTSTAPTSATQGALYTYSITTSDPDAADLRTLTATTKPTWLTFTGVAGSGIGTLSGTPAQAQVGVPQNVVLSVSDGTVSVTQSFTIVVANVDDQPLFTSTPVTTATQGTAYNYAITVTDGDNDPLTVTAPTKPTWLTFTAGANGSASLSGTPTQAEVGTHSVVLSATDGTAPPVTQSFQVVVTNADDQPVFTSTAVTAASQGALYSYAIIATDADNDALTFAAPTKPVWLTLTPGANGTATLSGTPAQAQVGVPQNVVVSVSDGTPPAVTQSFTIVVANVDDQPVFTSAAPPSVNEGASYVYAITATDPDGDPLTFTAPTLPEWLTFAPGTPGKATITSKPGRPSQADVGKHNVVLSVSDGTPPPVTQAFTIEVVSVDDAPVVGPIPAQTATEGVPFSLNLATFVKDVDTPLATLTYTAVSGLPPGLLLAPTGVLSGTPLLQLSPGEFTVAFTVRDALTPANGTFRLTVLRAGRADLGISASAAPNPAAVNATATWTFIIVNNATQVPVNGVAIEATFSGEVPFLFDALANPGCAVTLSGSDTRLACTLGALAGGATTSIALTGRGTAAGDVFVTTKVSIPGGVPIDETPGNDTAASALSIAQTVSASPAQQITGLNVLGAAAGDLNKDGFSDLAIVTPDSTAILLNVVDPANPAKRSLSSAPFVIGNQSPANGVAIADIDGDGDLDVVTAAGKDIPSRIFVNANSAFTAMPVGNVSENSRAVVAGDINGDALIDLVFANGSPSIVYKNQGPVGSYSAQPGLGNADSRGVVLIDLFGDALPELVFANGNGDPEIYRNTAGSFTIETGVLKNIGPTTSVAAADLNNDGRADLVFGHSAGSGSAPPRTQVWLNTSTTVGSFFKSAEFGASPTIAVAIADIDLDGDLDILTTNDTGAHHVYANAGTGGAFALMPQQLSSPGARAAVIGKFSVDDRIDVAFVGQNGGAVFYNDGKGNLGAGDTAAPTIQLKGAASVTLTVEDTYTDAGATATDGLDGDLSAKIVVANKVNTAVIGSYTVTYNVTDTSGNSAQAERTVRVQAREGTGGGGGGAVGFDFLMLLALAVMARNRQRAASAAPRTTGRA